MNSRRRRGVFALLGLALGARQALADDYRRPGLEGRWSERHLTAPMNSLRIIAGPGQPSFQGQRFGPEIADGGGQYLRGGIDPAVAPADEWWLRAGVGFGLTEDWEAAVLLVPLKFAPKFELASVTVAVTRGFRFRSFDVGLRFSFQSPGVKAYDLTAWGLNPGVPFLYRAGPIRLDGGVFVPVLTRDWTVGLNLPLRVSVNAGPRFFFGLESGFVEPRFATGGDAAVPVGALVGYTELFGSKVVDFTATFAWDDFWLPLADTNRLELGRYRAGLGFVFHTLVR